MPDLKFLKTEQKNEHIQHTNFDMSHKIMQTLNLGELKVTQLEPILPSDSAELRVNDEIICQPLENPAFSHFKLCHKTFYWPNTVLWKYWDNFITEKPDFTWTSSAIQSYIESEQPYTPPYFTWAQILPLVAFARGYVSDIRFGYYPIQDTSNPSNSPHLIRSQGNDTVVVSDLCNMGTRPTNTTDSITTNTPRVFTNFNALEAFDSNGDDTTRYNSSYAQGSLFATSFYNHINGGVNVSWTDGQPLTTSDFDKLRCCLLFKVDRYKQFQFEVNNESVDGVEVSYLKATPTNNLSYTINPSEAACSIALAYNDVQTMVTSSNHYVCIPLPAGFECSQYRMTMLSYLWYLCNNAVKLLDSMNIPVYIDELHSGLARFDALPFFAYSKFYHEYMANKQLQVNAPDWSEANGPICPTYTSYDSPDNHYTYGWILHHPEIPYNVNTMTYDEKLVIRNQFQAICLMLGLNLNSLLFSSALDYSTFNTQWNRSNKSLSHTYMVYNGLFHLQYSNFPPDYFTEALLDPLAGAKDINIPTTITQLQEKTKLQDFLNQTAWTRNIKEWLQSQWDSFSKYTTINEPSICGSSDVDINISQVLQTSESATTPLGTRAGVGSGYGNGYLCKEQFGEYGVLMTVSYIVLDTMYINRLDVRQRHKSSRFDYPLPQFANLGNESIDTTELNFSLKSQKSFGSSVYLSYISDTAQVPGFKTTQLPGDIMDSYSQSNGLYLPDNATPQALISAINRPFGYIPRYSIYKHHMDEVHGDFMTTLKRWVPSRELNHVPTYLNYVFISYELQSQISNLLKNFVNSTPFGDDNFLINHTNILHMRRALPYIVKPQL